MGIPSRARVWIPTVSDTPVDWDVTVGGAVTPVSATGLGSDPHAASRISNAVHKKGRRPFLKHSALAPPLPVVEGGFKTILADPPWRFTNRTGKVAPEHRRLDRYSTMEFEDIRTLPVEEVAAANAHLYLWTPNALLPEALKVMEAWGFRYVSNIVWAKRRKDGGPDGRGVGFYFRNVTEMLLFGVRGSMRTLQPAKPGS